MAEKMAEHENDDNVSAYNNLLTEINFFNDAGFVHKNDKWFNNTFFNTIFMYI